MTSFTLLVLFGCLHVCTYADKTRYTNEWIVEVEGGPEVADEIAQRHGFKNLGKIGNLQDHFRFLLQGEVLGLHMSSKSEAISQEKQVINAQQQVVKRRVKKGYTAPVDSQWHKQWSLKNTGQTNGPSGLDLNVEKAWLQNITGDGVVVGVVDDGLEWTHPDINENYDSFASHDFIHYDSDPSPDAPDDSSSEPNSHGTSCAGEIAMVKNSRCGVGVAYNSKVASLKFDVGSATDSQEASALGYKNDYIMIYSNSWGPSDFGFIVDGPESYVKTTFSNAVTSGRNGKGSIYIWAAGNGGQNYDSCAADGYVNSIYTIAVGSADQNGYQADYDEDCTAKMAVTYSYNSDTFPSVDDNWDPYNQITTIDLNDGCTDGFTGTSASAPLVSATIALTLEANSNLTWRDIQYLIVYTSDTTKLKGGEWTINGAGRNVSSQFGFGAIDAEAMVTRAKNWTNVPSQYYQHVYTSNTGSTYSHYTTTLHVTSSNILSLEHIVLTLTLTLENYGTEYDYDDLYDYIYDYYYNYYGRSEDNRREYNIAFKDFEYLEEVAKGNTDRDVYDWLGDSHPKRGDIKVELVSPSGTKSIVLPYRKYDFINAEGYYNWPFMSLHYWGENPIGTWTINVYFKSSYGYVSVHVNSFELYGTNVIPEAVSRVELSALISTLTYATATSSTPTTTISSTSTTTTSSMSTTTISSTSTTTTSSMSTTTTSSMSTTTTSSWSTTTNSSMFTTTTSYSPSTSPTPISSTSKKNDHIILPVVISGVALLLISIAIALFVIVIVVLKIRKKNQRSPRYQMMPLSNNEYKT